MWCSVVEAGGPRTAAGWRELARGLVVVAMRMDWEWGRSEL